jgi:hypothetical protein
MKDTFAAPGLPAEIPEHLRWAEVRIWAALGSLDLSGWQFAVKQNVLIGVRPWPGAGVDTLGVVGPDVVVASRDLIDAGHVWGAQGTVERMVQEIIDLGPPKVLR